MRAWEKDHFTVTLLSPPHSMEGPSIAGNAGRVDIGVERKDTAVGRCDALLSVEANQSATRQRQMSQASSGLQASGQGVVLTWTAVHIAQVGYFSFSLILTVKTDKPSCCVT